MKKFILFSCFIISIFLFNPLDSHAMTIDLYHDFTKCATCDREVCFYTGSGLCSTLNRISVHEPNYVLQNDSKYELYSSITLGINRSSNLGLRNDFYIGNLQGTNWIQGNTTWNNVDSINPGSNGFYNFLWGSVQSFTSTFSSNGISYDFYFSDPTELNYINVSRFELVNTGSSTNDAINNSTNIIINNNNQNTQNIIDSQNQINNTLTDDNVDESTDKAFDFFNNFDSGNTGTLTDIISLPLDFLDKLNDTCSSIVLPVPYMGNITLPCIQSYLSTFLPESFLNLIRLVVNGFLMYKIIISLIDFINTLKDPNNDDLEVMDL